MSIFFVSVTYSFFWLPQIVRSARRGRGSGLSKEYLVGTTLCRLYIALCEQPCAVALCFPLNINVDFLLCPKNVLDIEPRRELFSFLLISESKSERKIAWSPILAGFVCLQMAVVILQDTRLGPTFFLPQQVCD